MRMRSDILSDDATIDAMLQLNAKPNYSRDDFVNDTKTKLNKAYTGLKANVNKYRDTLDSINSYADR